MMIPENPEIFQVILQVSFHLCSVISEKNIENS